MKTNREPVAAASFSAGDDTVAEITGLAGQRVRLRALATASSSRADSPGTYVAGVDVAGDGGDEMPATAVLARFDKTSAKANAQVVASTALRVAPGQAWRRKFNLRGPSTLLVEVAGAGPVAARTQGVGVRLTLEPLLGANAPRVDGKRPRQWDVGSRLLHAEDRSGRGRGRHSRSHLRTTRPRGGDFAARRRRAARWISVSSMPTG